MPESTTRLISLDAIRCDGGTQPRDAIHDDVVAEYAERLAEGDEFPPVTLYHDGADYWLADGFHRVAAHDAAGLVEIRADVRQGTRRDAVLHSVGANETHGLRRTNADKRRAVLVLLEDAEWGRWSDREIARRCMVSHEFVSRLRRAQAPSLSTDDSEAGTRTYTTKHGTAATMNVGPIGAAPHVPVDEPDAPEDDAPPALKLESSTAAEPAEPEDEDSGIDPYTELEHALVRVGELEALVESLQKSDQGGEIKRLSDLYARLNGRVQQLQNEAGEARRQAQRQGTVLRKIREILGVERDSEIVPALMRRAA